MKSGRLIVLAFTTAFGFLTWSPPRLQTDTSAALKQAVGHWEGSITREGKAWKLWLDLRAEGEGVKGTADLPDYGLYALPLTVKLEGAKVVIQHFVRSSMVTLEGELAGEQMGGAWKGLDVAASCQLRRAQPQPMIHSVEEEVRFQNGEAMLVGTLVKPGKAGRHPAIVFTHGSGNQTRTESFYRSRAYLFARHGVAALVYDRRGRGASTGGGDDATWNNLADDALAGLSYLKSRADINPRKIGVGGFSQGGWVSPLAAARSQDVAFVLVGSTPGITPDEQNDFNVESMLRGQKLPEEKIAAVISLRRRVSQFQHTGKGDQAALESEISHLRGEPWFRNALLPEKLVPYDAESKSYILFDPAPVWEKVKAPVLSLWGAQDAVVPAEKSRASLERALKRGGNQDYTLRVFPKAGHGVGVIREPGEPWDWPRLAPGYQEVMIEWVLKRVTMGR